MNNNTEKVLTGLAFILAETIITDAIIKGKGVVHKNLPYVQEMSEKDLFKTPEVLGRNEAIRNIDLFNDILCNVLEKRLDWYYAEGFSEDLDDSYRFFSKDEIDEKNEEIYGDQYGQD